MKLHFVSGMDEVLKLALERDIETLSVTQAPTAAELASRPTEENITH
jgi:hypothetical protein